MLTQQVRQINERKGTCISRKFSKHIRSVDMKMCVFFLARLPSWRQVNTGRVVSCKARLMSLLKPLGCNGRFAGSYATLPIYYSSFLRWRQNQFQLKPSLAKTGTHSWTGRWAEIASDSVNIGCWEALGARTNLSHKLWAHEHLNQADMLKPFVVTTLNMQRSGTDKYN